MSSPPFDIIAEVLIAFAICLVGQICHAGRFLPVTGSGRVQLRAPGHVSRDFDLFCTRAKVVAAAKHARKCM